jgi:predicted membrane-bound mannosyltransferase/DNA-binding beta-propeller fold protein YncE
MEISREFSARSESVAHPVNRWLTGRIPLNWEFWVYLVILILAIFTRFYILGDRTMSHDESLHTKFSWDLYSTGIFQHTPLMHGPILFHMTALNYFLFGDNDFTARIYPAVLGVLMVMFPLLMRRWLGTWGAILASIMLLVSPLILFYNRYIREDTPSIFYTLVMVYCILMYLNGPRHLKRKARWLYIFSAAMLASLATKEVAFIYIMVFFLILALYWFARLLQHFFRMPARSIFYFLSLSVLVAGVAAVGMYIILAITPLDSQATLTAGTIENVSLIRWTVLTVIATLIIIVAPALWTFLRNGAAKRMPWLEVLTMIALVVVVTCLFIIVEERSHVQTQDAAQAAAPVVPGEDGAVVTTAGYIAWPLYAEWIACGIAVVLLVGSRLLGWWKVLLCFPELDLLLIMATLVVPWATPFVMKAMNPASLMSIPDIANAVNFAFGNAFDTSQFSIQVFLVSLTVIPAIAVSFAAGLVWNRKRWLISLGVFVGIFLFFFTTVFTNMNGIFTGMLGSLGYWLEQQAVRRGNQPQYYYLALILPFYEFLPIIGSMLATFAGMGLFWKFRRERMDASRQRALAESNVQVDEEGMPLELPVPKPVMRHRPADPTEWLRELPVLIFIAWWAIFNLIAYTLAGEKMPWLGTHMTMPMILLAGWYFGRYFQRIDLAAFVRRNWLYLLLLPALFVAVVQVISPLAVGGVGGLQQDQLTRIFHWLLGIAMTVIVGGAIIWLAVRNGWMQLRMMLAVSVFTVLTFLTFRSAWMASFINYDLATEFLVYAHSAPANKEVTNQLEDLSWRITGGMELNFAYDNKISWPGAWYFRDFDGAVFLGENPSLPSYQDAAVVIVGDENRATVESTLEDRYFRFDYPRMWWPMQDYFGLTAQRVIDTFDLTNPTAAQVRAGMWDIWWSRDYTGYADALQRDFSLPRWPVADRMYVFVRKDIAAQVWDLGVGDGTALVSSEQEVNQCTANWQDVFPLQNLADVNQSIQLNTPRQMAIAPDGRLYVAEEFNHRISVFNPDGTYAFSFGEMGQLYQAGDPYFGQGNGPQTGNVMNRPNGVAVGVSGTVYVADTWNYRVMVFTAEGEFITAWGQRGEFGQSAAAQPFDGFWGPRSITVDAQENVYVADTGNKRVRVYTSTGQWLRDIGGAGSGVGQLEEPSGLVIGPTDGLLYVADYWNRRVSVFNTDGTPALRYVDRSGQQVNHFRVRGWIEDVGNRPYLAIDPLRNALYASDPDAGRVLVYTLDGNCFGSFGQLGREGLQLNQFANSSGLAVDSNGSVFVGDAPSGRVLRFDAFPGLPVMPSGSVGLEQPLELPAEVTTELIQPELTPEATEAAAG